MHVPGLRNGFVLAVAAALVGGLSCGGSDETSSSTSSCSKADNCARCASCVEKCMCANSASQATCQSACAGQAGGAGGTVGTGGTLGSGGSPATGGSLGSGGSTGGNPGTGGAPGTGGTGGIGTGGSGATSAATCFADITNGPVVFNYDQFNPIVNSTCTGTNHQDIQGLERVVFLGDSIMAGTPPTTADQFARTKITNALQAKFPNIAVQDCSAWGAKTSDLLGGNNQIGACFPSVPDQRKTLTVIIMGGNDLAAIAKAKPPIDQALQMANTTVAQMLAALQWLKDPVQFPNGSYVVFADTYEYTDTSCDMSSCYLATTQGLSGVWLDGIQVLTTMNEGYMKDAVDTQSDFVFMEEHFCGHGYHACDTTLQCYRGIQCSGGQPVDPANDVWFDVTCIHPTPVGHGHIADYFTATINE